MTLLTLIWQIVISFIVSVFIERFWLIENLSGIFIFGIPIEELLFAFALGFGGSIYYEYITGQKYKKT